MSLDIWFECQPCERCGRSDSSTDFNITHNLGQMARAADIYNVLWRPDENAIDRAEQMIGPLEVGLARLKAEPAFFRTFDAPNGWGLYEHFVPFVEKVLAAAKENPQALVKVSR